MLCVAFAMNAAIARAQPTDEGYKLLLTAQRLRRLQRDRQRKTLRWLNFEKRVETVPDSPERGFELALYYAVTRDEARGREAVEWAKNHLCDERQVALVFDWCRGIITAADRARSASCVASSGSITALRDALFAQTSFGTDEPKISALPPATPDVVLNNSTQLYALCEYLITARALSRTDLRQDNSTFFRALPNELLLSLMPDQVDHPDWIQHIAALALVAVDPNLEGSQFLQGWAMEDNQTLTEGPGVAYEFLWADPYLPGVAYRNLDPWVYDPAGRLFARTSWDSDSCWLSNNFEGLRTKYCDRKQIDSVQKFGTLTLLPMNAQCVDLPKRQNRESLVLWRLNPGEAVTYRGEGKKDVSETADPRGMWLVPENAHDKVCRGRAGKR